MSHVARHVRVTGRVQGVFFRAWTAEQARILRVCGWVRNAPDGSVEAHLQGDKWAVQRMIELLHRGGSAVSRTWPVHGKVAQVRHDGSGLFEGLPSPFAATRYHSLAVSDPLPPLIANAWSEDGTVMAMRHRDAPVHGI